METFVFVAVLFAAACHAGWNALIKVGLDPLSTTTLISVGSGIVALAFAPFVGTPAPAAWPWLLASVVIHLVYFASLIESYRTGDLGQVYPLARGSAPLMTAALSTVLVGETLGPLAWIGIVALAAGVLLLSARGGRALARFDAHATGLALFTATTICAYSLVDGIGARTAGNAGDNVRVSIDYTYDFSVGSGELLDAIGLPVPSIGMTPHAESRLETSINGATAC